VLELSPVTSFPVRVRTISFAVFGPTPETDLKVKNVVEAILVLIRAKHLS
jgi:hypothetical protein